ADAGHFGSPIDSTHAWQECPPNLQHTAGLHLARQDQSAGDAFEEELENLDVPPGFGQVAAPSVKAVPANQVAVLQRIGGIVHSLADLLGQLGNILRVVENFDPGGCVVRGDAL